MGRTTRCTLVVAMMLVSPLCAFQLPPGASGGTTTSFANGSGSLELQFPTGGGDLTVFAKVPAASLALSTALTIRGEKIPNEKSFVHTSQSDFATGLRENLSFGLDNLTRDPQSCRFSAMNAYAAGRVPHYIAAGDLNGDGRKDVAVTNRLSNNTGVFFQDPAGELEAMLPLPVGGSPNGIAIGDLNGDGRNDLVVAAVRSDLTGYVALFNQSGPGSFPVRDELSAGTYPDGVAVGLLNNDALPDIAVANYGDGTVGVFLQKAGGGFYPMVAYTVGSGPRCVAIGDVNNDGRADLVNTVFFDNKTVIHFQASNGQLQMPAAKMDSGFHPVGLCIGDVNSDGRPDVVVANSLSNTTGVFYQKADASLQGMVNVPSSGFQTWQVAAGDLNDDRKADIAVSNLWPNTDVVDVSSEDLAGRLTGMTTLPALSGPDGVAIADLNGDGLNDVVSANSRSDNIGVFLQRPYKGVFTSGPIAAPINIVGLCATWVQTLDGAPVKLEFSNNDGQNWSAGASGQPLVFATTGQVLRYRITISSATGLDELRVAYTLDTLYPSDLALDVGGDDLVDWSRPGQLTGEEMLGDVSQNITDYVQIHPELADPEGNISVPLRFHSSSAGILNLSGLAIEFNIPPRLNDYSPKGDPIVVSEGGLQNFTVNATDAEGEPLAYSWYLDGGLQPGTDRTFQYRPGYDQAGFHNLTVNITDGKSTVSMNWELRIRNVNRPPEITEALPAGDPGSREGVGVTFSATVRDPDFDTVTVEWFLDGVRVKSEAGGAANYPYRPAYGDAGPHEVVVAASDAEQARASRSWKFNVTAVNPITEFGLAQPAGDVSLDEGGEQDFLLDAAGLQKVLGPFTLKWRLDGNFTVNTAGYTYSPGYGESGSHAVTLTVTAGTLTYQRLWRITVREITNPPVITQFEPVPGEISMKEGDKLTFGVKASDPENDALSYRWLLTYNGIFDLQVSASPNYTFEANYSSEGRYTVKVVVSDGKTQAQHSWDLVVVDAVKPVPPAAGSDMLMTAIAVLVVLVVLGAVLAVAWKKRESMSAAMDKMGGGAPAAPTPAAPVAAAPKYEEPPKPKPKPTYPCPSCGQPAAEDWFVCHTCGAELKGAADMPAGVARPGSYETRATEEALARSRLSIEALECPKCGKILEMNQENCPTCGEFVRKLEPEGAVTAPAGNCPSCGQPVESGWLKCPECGAQLAQGAGAGTAEAAMLKMAGETPPPQSQEAPKAGGCQSCGNPVEAGWTKCPECGTELG